MNYRDASRDPLNGKDPARVTTSFREAPAADPESSLIGNYYECNPVSADWVVADPSMWMFEGSRASPRASRSRRWSATSTTGSPPVCPPRRTSRSSPTPPSACRGNEVLRRLDVVLGAERRRRVLRRHVRVVAPAGRRLPRRPRRPPVQAGEGHREHPAGVRRRPGRCRPSERRRTWRCSASTPPRPPRSRRPSTVPVAGPDPRPRPRRRLRPARIVRRLRLEGEHGVDLGRRRLVAGVGQQVAEQHRAPCDRRRPSAPAHG